MFLFQNTQHVCWQRQHTSSVRSAGHVREVASSLTICYQTCKCTCGCCNITYMCSIFRIYLQEASPSKWDFKTDGWPPVPIPKPSPQPRPPWIELRLALPMLRQWFDAISAGTVCGFMGFQNWRMAPCPDPKALPAAETLDSAAAGFTHAAAMVWCDFGWHPVWLHGISKLTDGPLSRSQSPPRSRDLLELSCGWLYPCYGNGLMRFRLAPCLASWDFKTDGWPPVPIPKPSPQPRPPWIELRLALPMLRQWFDAISAGTVCGFMGFQNWRMAPCPDPKALPAAETLDSAAAGFTHAAAQKWPLGRKGLKGRAPPRRSSVAMVMLRKPCYDFSFRPPLKPKRGGRRHPGDSPFYPAMPCRWSS